MDYEDELAQRLKDEKAAARLWENRDTDIDYAGTKITLPGEPGPMPLRTAIATLERKAADEETMLDVHEILDAYPEDSLVALNKAMRERYGWASPTPKMTFFGPVQPDLITVKTGPYDADSVQVPYGMFTLPGVENPIEVRKIRGASGMVLVIIGSVRKREAAVVKELANIARRILREQSIYKGKAIRLTSNPDGTLNEGAAPQFLHTDNIVVDELILNPIELDQVRCALWAPIQHTEACIANKIPLNRGILLEGIYGTGKTMTASVTSRICVDNGWTYVVLDDVRSLAAALLFAQRYAPAVVFAEDVDRVVENRDQKGNDLLNTIDGVLTKNSQVITVLTTNHVEKLDRAMLRPGRLDAVISVHAPGPEAVGKLIRLYGRELIGPDEDLAEVGRILEGNIPATIREVVERSKLAMIANGNDIVRAEDLEVAAHGMAGHLALLREEKTPESVEQRVGRVFAELIDTRIDGNEVSEKVREIHASVA